MRTLYNLLFPIFFGLTAPYYFWRLRRRGNWQHNFAQRFGKYDASLKQALTNRHIVWIHAVSVGEAGLCAQLIRALEPHAPNVTFVVSCTTTTGMAELRRRLPTEVHKIYYPIDRRKWVRRALATIKPAAIILVEAEIWPNFLWRARDLGIPVFLANARLSDRSYPRYKKLRFLFRPLFASLAGVGCQNAEDAERLRAVGCRAAVVHAVGNLKFDFGPVGRGRVNARALLRQAGVPDDALVLVAGSTHDGEEILLADMTRRLREKFPKLFLVLVPRHFERCPDLSIKLRARGVKLALRSALAPETPETPQTQLAPGAVDTLLVNTTGELKAFYEPATVVFIGKSLAARGGQNPIEPAAQGKAVVCGPNMQNFTDIVRLFRAQNAIVQVADEKELETALAGLLADADRRAALGRAARAVVQENLGAVDRTVELILPALRERGVLVKTDE